MNPHKLYKPPRHSYRMKIKIYTTPTCPYSNNAKKFFKKRKLEFEEITLMKDEEARLAMIEKSGQMATPVIEINEEIIVGFDETALKKVLKEQKEK